PRHRRRRLRHRRRHLPPLLRAPRRRRPPAHGARGRRPLRDGVAHGGPARGVARPPLPRDPVPPHPPPHLTHAHVRAGGAVTPDLLRQIRQVAEPSSSARCLLLLPHLT